MQRYYREINNSFSPRSKEKKEVNLRIPSLFDIKVRVPNDYRGTEDLRKSVNIVLVILGPK